MILHESKNARVEWFEQEKVILKRFSGFITGDEMRVAFDAGYKQLQKANGEKWLSDNRDLPVYKQEDVDWINEDWFPRMLEAGWRYWALVEPKSHVGTMTMKKFRFYVDEGIILKVFATVEEAFSWLATVD